MRRGMVEVSSSRSQPPSEGVGDVIRIDVTLEMRGGTLAWIGRGRGEVREDRCLYRSKVFIDKMSEVPLE